MLGGQPAEVVMRELISPIVLFSQRHDGLTALSEREISQVARWEAPLRGVEYERQNGHSYTIVPRQTYNPGHSLARTRTLGELLLVEYAPQRGLFASVEAINRSKHPATACGLTPVG